MSETKKLISVQIEQIESKFKEENISISFRKIPYLNIIEYYIEITIFNEKTNEKNEFILDINLVYNTIHLYSKNLKYLSDGRDLFPYITNSKNAFFNLKEFKLLTIIQNTKNFLTNVSEAIKNNSLDKNIGNFYLGEEYDILLIKSLQELKKIPCRHIETIKQIKTETPSLCCISDNYFCLYEFGIACNKYLTNDEYKFTLVFYSTLDLISSFQKDEDNSILLFWKTKYEDTQFVLKIKSDIISDINFIMDTLINQLKSSGKNMEMLEKKEGEIPKIDIEEIEKEISNYEIQLKEKEDKETFDKLLKCYEQAITYYSAINNDKYIDYNNKIQELLKNEKYSEYIK